MRFRPRPGQVRVQKADKGRRARASADAAWQCLHAKLVVGVPAQEDEDDDDGEGPAQPGKRKRGLGSRLVVEDPRGPNGQTIDIIRLLTVLTKERVEQTNDNALRLAKAPRQWRVRAPQDGAQAGGG